MATSGCVGFSCLAVSSCGTMPKSNDEICIHFSEAVPGVWCRTNGCGIICCTLQYQYFPEDGDGHCSSCMLPQLRPSCGHSCVHSCSQVCMGLRLLWQLQQSACMQLHGAGKKLRHFGWFQMSLDVCGQSRVFWEVSDAFGLWRGCGVFGRFGAFSG